jgi:hypothetical protein
MTAVTGAASWFTLRVPDSWFEFDVWRATRTGDLARLVDARIAQVPALRPRRSALLKMLREVAERAERQGAVFCASMAELVDGSEGLVANVMVFHTEGAPNEVDNTVEAIAGQVTAVAPDGVGSPWRTVEIVEIPAGQAVRVRGVERGEPDGVATEGVVMHTLIPVPGGRGVLDVVLTSPHVDIPEALFGVFEAVSDSLDFSLDRPAGVSAAGLS